MYPSFNPGHIGLKVSLDRGLELAERHGFQGYDPGFAQVSELVAESGAEKVAARFSAKGLKVGASNLPFAPYRVSDDEWSSSLKESLPSGMDALAAIGGERLCMWILPGHDEMEFDQNFEHHVKRFQPIAQLAEERGIRLALEFIGPKTSLNRFKYPFIYDLEGIRKLATAVGHGTGLLLDSWHWYTSGGTVDDLSKLAEGELAHVHINDAPLGVAREEQIDNQRQMPCTTGVIDLRGFMDTLVRLRYNGPVTAEPFDAEVNAMSDEDEATAINARAVQAAFGLIA